MELDSDLSLWRLWWVLEKPFFEKIARRLIKNKVFLVEWNWKLELGFQTKPDFLVALYY